MGHFLRSVWDHNILHFPKRGLYPMRLFTYLGSLKKLKFAHRESLQIKLSVHLKSLKSKFNFMIFESLEIIMYAPGNSLNSNFACFESVQI